MGGPQSVYDDARSSISQDELRLIESALKDNRPVLGVCLGSQLLAASLGAESLQGASRNRMGSGPAHSGSEERSPARGEPEEFTAFHWHGDVFDLPRDSVALASSDISPIQAFRYGDKSTASSAIRGE